MDTARDHFIAIPKWPLGHADVSVTTSAATGNWEIISLVKRAVPYLMKKTQKCFLQRYGQL